MIFIATYLVCKKKKTTGRVSILLLPAISPDIRALSDADQDRRLLRNVYYYKYTTTQRQEVIPTCSEPVILPEGTDVTVVDKDDDGVC